MRIWATKYALTRGIIEADSLEGRGDEDYVVIPKDGIHMEEHFLGKGRQWHDNKEDAIAKANSMRVREIENLKKKITKLEEMKFE